jgi:ketohexokinase
MKILGVGTATLDIINRVARYPEEDSEVRALSQRRCRGGNATNSLSVLAQLGHECAWAGLLTRDGDAAFIEQQLRAQQIDLKYVHYLSSGKLPTSYITLSEERGTRSIVHYRELPEYRAEWFVNEVDPSAFEWIHFEARAAAELEVMLKAAGVVDGLQVSLEVEKPRAGIEALFHLPDLLLLSRHYALACGHSSAQSLLQSLALQLGSRRPLLFCAWGEEGAWALPPTGELLHAPAVRVARVVDSLAAGDVFNAAVIDATAAGRGADEALAQGCRLAAEKCSREGLENLWQ